MMTILMIFSAACEQRGHSSRHEVMLRSWRLLILLV
jgi:hypothetical protein